MINIKEIKHELSKKYDISVEEIDDGLMPILISLEHHLAIMDVKTDERLTNIDKLVAEIDKKNKQTLVINDPKIAWIMSFSKFGLIPICCTICYLIYSIANYQPNNDAKYKYLERLSKIVNVNQDNQFYIDKDKYEIIKHGILIKESKK